METKEGYGERAHPEYWKRVTDLYPGLRVNLGHCGGMANLVHERNDWPLLVWKMMQDPSRQVFADSSYVFEIGDSSFRERLFDRMAQLFETHENVKGRLMFGTDWLMLAKRKGARDFLRTFGETYLARFGPECTAGFLGGNAARFLGLHPGAANRRRLEAFYERHGMATPEWMNRLE
jgi:predicted TIM-barrel fold metal-dependent hydrolase